jgi:hypothetical protein
MTLGKNDTIVEEMCRLIRMESHSFLVEEED